MFKRKKSAASPRRGKKGRAEQQPKEDAPPSRIPVTLLSGFLGSGKTCLLQHILTSKEHQLKVAVIVNDMAELNIDAQAILRNPNNQKDDDGTTKGTGGYVVQTKKEVITLENGCICCTLRGDLIREISRIQKLNQFDYILIESTGIAEPQAVAESFCVDPETQALAGTDSDMLWNAARLDTCVTVVDTVNFPTYLSSLNRFKDIFRDGITDPGDLEGEKSIAELMVEQVEFANVIVLNKVDLVSKESLKVVKDLIETLNPKAKVVTGSYGKIDLHQIVNTHLFNMKDASESPGWLVSLKDKKTATVSRSEADEHGVSSFVYRRRKPFHPVRVHSFIKQFFCLADEWNSEMATEGGGDDDEKDKTKDMKRKKELENKYGEILRSKGTCWIAGRDDHEICWHQAGCLIQLSPVKAWYCKTDPEEWPGADTEQGRAKIEEYFSQTDELGNSVRYEYEDRRQELVFIGTKLQQKALEEELDKCLLTNKEMKFHSANLPLGTYPDPFSPIVVHCIGAQSLFVIARFGQNQHFRIFQGFSLTLHNVVLNMTQDDANIKAVKVWLDKSAELERGLLLATLRPGSHEQQSISLPLLPCDVEGGEPEAFRRIRVEVIPHERSHHGVMDLMMACEVHILGKIEPLPYGEEEMEGDEVKKGRGDAGMEDGCSDPECFDCLEAD